MQGSALHDTRTRATPSQLREAAARTARLARIADAARLPTAAAPGIAFEQPKPQRAADIKPSPDAYEAHRARGGSPLDARLTFANLFVGSCNSVAVAALRQASISRDCDPILYNPLFVHGGTGCGKSHLLQASVWEALSNKRRALYISAERFNNRTVDTEFLAEVDLIAIDDLQYVSGKVGYDGIGRAVNMMANAGRQVIIGSDRPIYDLEGFEDRTVSHLASGLVIEAAQLSADVRTCIAERRSAALEIVLPGEVRDYVVTATVQGGRGIEGAINRLAFHIRNNAEPLTLATAEVLMRDFVVMKERRIKIEEIQRAVARHFRVSLADILSARRTANVVMPRQIAMYLAKTLTLRSLPEIGRHFGGRDHTTVLHAVRKIERLLPQDRKLEAAIESIKTELRI